MTIRCKKCRKVKKRGGFSDEPTRPSGHHPWCTLCEKKFNASAKFQDPTAALNGLICPLCDTPVRGRASRKYCSDGCRARCASLESQYGLSVPDYRRLVESCNGLCPICQRRPTQWHVDHNHRTGLTTGTVCSGCNVGALASTYHDVEMVRRLLAFLENTPASRLGIEAVAPEGATRPSRIHSQWSFGNPRRAA